MPDARRGHRPGRDERPGLDGANLPGPRRLRNDRGVPTEGRRVYRSEASAGGNHTDSRTNDEEHPDPYERRRAAPRLTAQRGRRGQSAWRQRCGSLRRGERGGWGRPPEDVRLSGGSRLRGRRPWLPRGWLPRGGCRRRGSRLRGRRLWRFGGARLRIDRRAAEALGLIQMLDAAETLCRTQTLRRAQSAVLPGQGPAADGATVDAGGDSSTAVRASLDP